MPLSCILGQSALVEGRSWYGKAPDSIIAGDASNKASCSFGVRDMPNFYMQKKFTEEESRMSSGHRELLTVRHALDKEAVFAVLEPGKRTILWLTDSANMVTFLTKGSTKPAIQKEILEVFKKIKKLAISIIPVHVSRKDYRIQLADKVRVSSTQMTGVWTTGRSTDSPETKPFLWMCSRTHPIRSRKPFSRTESVQVRRESMLSRIPGRQMNGLGYVHPPTSSFKPSRRCSIRRCEQFW